MQSLINLPDKAKTIICNNKAQVKAKGVKEGLIPKPVGCHSCDFNIFDKMQADGKIEVTKDTYNNLIVSRLHQQHGGKINLTFLLFSTYPHFVFN